MLNKFQIKLLLFNKIFEWENYVTAKMIVMRLIIRIKLNKMRSYFIAIKLNYLKDL